MMEMYFLYEWVQDREAKLFCGIFSTVGFAKKYAEAQQAEHGDFDGLDEGEVPTLTWKLEGEEWAGYKNGEFDQDYPFMIEPFELNKEYAT